MPFTGLVSFMRVPTCTDLDRIDADIANPGAPSDEGSPWKPGSRFAPRKIRELSVKYAGYGPVQHQLGYYDIDEDRRYLEYERRQSRIADCGDSDIVYTNVRRTFDNITAGVRRILDAGAFPVVIGGDHAVTYPVVRAYSERLNVVHGGRRAAEAVRPEVQTACAARGRGRKRTTLIAAELIMELLGRIVESPLNRKRHPAARPSRARAEVARARSRRQRGVS